MSVDDVLDHLLPEGWRDRDPDAERVVTSWLSPASGWTSRASTGAGHGCASTPRRSAVTEQIARFLGTGRYLVVQTRDHRAVDHVNTLSPRGWQFDPYPTRFIFLTLILSLQAAYAAPLILLAQNRQDDRDRVNLEADREEARESKADLDYLAREIAAIRMALGEVATRDFLRSELTRAEAARESQRKDPEAGAAREAETPAS